MEKGKEFTDDDLITAFKNYDQEAINYIYKTHYQPLCYFVRGLIRNKAEAEDIVIEAFIKLLRKHKDFDSLPHLKGFLYTVTRNDSISFLRMVKKKTERDKELIYLMEKDEDFIQSRMVKAELLKKILDEVERLPAVRKNIFKLIFLEGLTTQEIAGNLKITMDTVRVQKARALQAIRSALLKKGLVSVTSLYLITLFNNS